MPEPLENDERRDDDANDEHDNNNEHGNNNNDDDDEQRHRNEHDFEDLMEGGGGAGDPDRQPDRENDNENNDDVGGNGDQNNNNVIEELLPHLERRRLDQYANGQSFPTPPTAADLDEVRNAFRTEQSSAVCGEVVCASCDRLTKRCDVTTKPLTWSNLRKLNALDHLPASVKEYYEHATANNGLPTGLVTALLGFIIDSGAVVPPADATQVRLCNECFNALKNNRRPSISLSNDNAPGPIPDELRVLTRRELQCVALLVLRANIHRIER